jgi:hypothetical protein
MKIDSISEQKEFGLKIKYQYLTITGDLYFKN